ncbi:MAG: AzlC family ABC transporter permease [Acidimicrobiia bacterium]
MSGPAGAGRASRDPEVRRVVAGSLALSAAVGVFGFSFGVAAVGAGASAWQAMALSVFVFTGASQFSAMSVVGAGGSVVTAYAGAALLAVRNLVYGVAMSGPIREMAGGAGRRAVAAHFVIDETTGLALAEREPRLRRVAFVTTAVALFAFWNGGTALGALVGGAVDPRTWGLDVAFPAAFVAMLPPHLRTRAGRRAALLGAAICLVAVPLAPVGVPVILAAVAIVVGLRP